MLQIFHTLDYVKARVDQELKVGKFAGAERDARAIVVGGKFGNEGLEEGGQVGVVAVGGVDESLGVGIKEGLLETFFANMPVEHGEGDPGFGGAELSDVL